MQHDAEDLVVGLAAGELRRQLGDDRLGLQEQAAGGGAAAAGFERDAVVDVAGLRVR